MERFIPTNGQAAPATLSRPIPHEVLQLYPRERELALSVYALGLATANEIESVLSRRLSNAAVRSMLNRLVGKGLLSQLQCGRGDAYVYAPAISVIDAREAELRQCADDFFGGSLVALRGALLDWTPA